MTDIDEAVVNGTIATLTTTLERATARLTLEEEEYNAKRDRMVAVAHQRGNDNSIGEALDDLLEEFGLPRRPQRGYLRCVLMVNAPVNQSGETIMTDTNQYVYRTDQVRVSWPVVADHTGSMREGDTCLCDNAEENIRVWLEGSFGEAAARTMHFQIGDPFCGIDACPNRPGRRYPDLSDTIAWHEKPMHVVTEVTASDATPTGEPRVGETWYMVGNNTYGTNCRDGEPVMVTGIDGRHFIAQRQNGSRAAWRLLPEHIRPVA
jgi:hypothetical protein